MKKKHDNLTISKISNFAEVVGSTSTLRVLLGVCALFAAAQLSIPLKPVPITFHTIIISLLGLTYSPRLGFITVLTYIFMGAIGLPMFTKLSSGLTYIAGATGGYLVGFLLAVPLMAMIKNTFSRKFWGVAYCCLIGHIVIYALGIAWLSTLIGLKQAIYSGFLIYIPTGLLKIAIFSYLFSYINTKSKQ